MLISVPRVCRFKPSQAASVAGVTLAVALSGTYFPPFELVDVTIYEVLIQLLKFHPEAVIFWDYATSPPTLRVKGRGALSTVTREVEYEGSQSQLLEYAEGSDDDVRGIVLSYEVETVTDGEIFREYVEDSAGVTTGLNVVRQTIPWRGKSSSRTLQTQPIKTEDIPGPSGTNIKNWVKKHIPELSGADNGNLTVESVDASEFIDWDDDDGTQPSEASRMLVYGHKTDWMASSFWECAVNVKVEITWGGGPGDAGADAFPPGQKTRTFVVRVTGTNMTSRPSTSCSASKTIETDISLCFAPFGRPKWASNRTFAPLSASSLTVGNNARKRVSSVTRPSAMGTFKSTRTNTRFPFMSPRSSSVRNAMIKATFQ